MAIGSNIGLLLKALVLQMGGKVKLSDDDIARAKNVKLEAGRIVGDPDLVIRIKEDI